MVVKSLAVHGRAGSKGNKTQTMGPLLTFCLLSLPVLILYIYYLELQTYVLKIDHFLGIVGVVFLGLQVREGETKLC